MTITYKDNGNSLVDYVVDLGHKFNLTASGTVSQSDSSANNNNLNASWNGDEEQFKNAMTEFFKRTGNLMIMNDFANANETLETIMSTEYTKADKLRSKTKNEVQKTRQKYLMKKYKIAYHLFVTNIIQFSLWVTILVALMFGFAREGKYFSYTWAGILSSILILIFFLVILIVVKNHQTRRKDDWNKFYFKSKNDGSQNVCKYANTNNALTSEDGLNKNGSCSIAATAGPAPPVAQ